MAKDTVARWERGERTQSVAVLQILADALGVYTRDFIELPTWVKVVPGPQKKGRPVEK